jgi:hypothetical protein
MQILRHSKIAVTMEIYTEVPSLPPATRFVSSATGSPDGCCRLLLPEDHKRPVPWLEPACEVVGDTGIEPVTSSV